jgi:hypothetical protein
MKIFRDKSAADIIMSVLSDFNINYENIDKKYIDIKKSLYFVKAFLVGLTLRVINRAKIVVK